MQETAGEAQSSSTSATPACSFADGNQIVGVMAAAVLLRSWKLAQEIEALLLGGAGLVPMQIT